MPLTRASKRQQSPRYTTRQSKRHTTQAEKSLTKASSKGVTFEKNLKSRLPTLRDDSVLSEYPTIQYLQHLNEDERESVEPVVHLVESLERYLGDIPYKKVFVSHTRETKLKRAPTLEILQNSVLRLNNIKSRRMVEKIRDVAVEHLASDLLQKLKIISENVGCVPHKNLAKVAPDNVFGWTWTDFWERCQNKNSSWIDVLLLSKVADLQVFKFERDMKELRKLLKIFFKGFTSDAPFAKDEVHEYIRDAYEYVEIYDILTTETENTLRKLQDDVNMYLECKVAHKRAGETAYLKALLEEEIEEANIILPIELRHQLNWLDTKIAQAMLKKNMEIEGIDKQVESRRLDMDNENNVSKSVQENYEWQVEFYTQQIQLYKSKYDTDFEKLDNDISFMKLNMDKMRAQRTFLEEQMARFREEMQLMHQQMIEEEEREEREAMEKKQAQEAKLMEKKSKNKKEKKKKK